jgi:hypothetical protein
MARSIALGATPGLDTASIADTKEVRMVRVPDSQGGSVRIRSLLGLLFSLTILAVFIAPPATAVHDLGVFELEGNANNEAPPGDDWDNVCKQVTGSTATCGTATGTTGADATSWLSEPNRSSSIFTGGGSKDPENLSAWAWKDAGGLPDKDNLRHSFAARYTVAQSDGPPATSCPTSIAGTTCDILYFGSDRFDNSGDAQQGFWFLQNECSLGSTKSGGGFDFDCVEPGTPGDPSDDFHRVGDLLVLTDFSNGGDVSTINIYQWTGSGLSFLAGGDAQKCGGSATDPFCGIVNAGTITMPWSFTDKSLTPSNGALNGEFFEAGVNLSSPQINLGGECFATLVSETRSSTSTTATLKDFVIGGFGRCTSSVASEQSWIPRDSATVTASRPTFTGTVTFSLWSTATCTGTALYTSNAIAVSNADPTASTDDATTPPGTAQAVSASTSRYWKVFFNGDTPIPDATTCVEQTDLVIDNDNSN